MGEIHRLEASLVLPCMAEMAVILLQQLVLRVGTRRYRLADIEFYLHSQTHADPFIHGDDEQRQCGRWYYNRAGGLDLTFGNGTNAGGILLRGLVLLEAAPTAVYGPQRVLRELIAGQEPVWKPTEGWWLEADLAPPGPVWQTERVNLKQLESPFRPLPYRFLAHADYLQHLPSTVRHNVWKALGLTKEALVVLNSPAQAQSAHHGLQS
jgi:hypothetical protein